MIFRVQALILVMASTIFAYDFFVAPPPAGNDSNNGTSWATPFATIQKAVDTALDGQSIAVTNGVYTNVPVNINKGVSVITVNGHTVTKIMSDGNPWIVGGVNKRCVSLTHSNALLEGFTLEKGNITVNKGYGGGAYISAGTIRNCVITNCMAVFQHMVGGGAGGGGVHITGGLIANTKIVKCFSKGWDNNSYGGGIFVSGGVASNLQIVSCLSTTVSSAAGFAGGIFMNASSAKVLNSVVVSNQVGGQGGGNNSGGGVYMTAGFMKDCLIANNFVEVGKGGGLYITGGTGQNVRVLSNTAAHRYMVGGNSYGAGVYMTGGLLYGAIISNNYNSPWNADAGGGAYIDGTGASLINSIISHNSTHNTAGGCYGMGGGIYIKNGLVRGCIISANGITNSGSYYKTRYGGGIYMYGGTVESCTVMHNYCSDQGGGIYMYSGATVINTVVWSNYASSASVADFALYSSNIVSYSCAPSSSLPNGTGNISQKPLIKSWGIGYGRTAMDGDYHILNSHSSIFDKGTVLGWMNGAFDIDGQKRIMNEKPDIGADELFFSGGLVVMIK